MTPLISRRHLLALAATIAVTGGARAQDATEVRQPVTDLYATLEKLMRAGQATPFPERFNVLAPIIDRVYDLEAVLRVSVGTRWPTFDTQSRTTLAEAFRAFTVASFVANFDKYEGERFEVLPELRTVGADQVVQTRIVSASGEPIRLDYVMQPSETGWRVTDVLLDGSISRVAVQRSDFRALLAHGDASALIASLRRKVAHLSGGTMVS